jgi:hypothetical protein
LGVITDPAKRLGVQLRSLGAAQDNRLIAPQSGGLVDLLVGSPRKVQVAFGPRHEEGHALRTAGQSRYTRGPSYRTNRVRSAESPAT